MKSYKLLPQPKPIAQIGLSQSRKFFHLTQSPRKAGLLTQLSGFNKFSVFRKPQNMENGRGIQKYNKNTRE